MKLSEICIKRPVFATVLSLLLLVFGFIGYSHLETRYFPKVVQPFANVSVTYQGASPSLMNTAVTTILENSLIDVDNISSIHSTSGYGSSSIYMHFAPGTNLVLVMGQVRDAVSQVRQQLPTDIDPPSISSGGAARPVLNVGFTSPHLNQSKIRDYVTQVIQPPLLTVPGMGGAWIYGASDYAMRIWLDPEKMAAFGVTTTDVQNALKASNVDFSGGSIQGKNRSYSIVSETRLRSAEQFGNMVIRDVNGQVVRLRNVAEVKLGSVSLQNSPMRINGVKGVDLEIRPMDSANPITVAKASKAVLAKLRKHLPPGMKMVVTYDQASFLHHAISESFSTLIEAIILVMIVVFLFLGTLRAAFIPIVTIPVCVIGVFGMMLVMGFSINVMTLLAIILAIGLVVDDAIVVLENVHRHIEGGMEPLKAALKGSKEIGFAIVAMTLTLAAVYAPVGFIQGFSATVFREFAFTLAGAVLISGFVALTLTPMMCGHTLRAHTEGSRYEKWLEVTFKRVTVGYRAFLDVMLNQRWGVVGAVVVVAVLGYFLYISMPQAFIPKEDIGYFTTSITTPPGSSVTYTDKYMRKVNSQVYAKIPAILSNAAFVFSGSANNFVTLKPWNQRSKTVFQVLDEVTPALNNVPGALAYASVPDPVQYGPNTGGKPVQLHILTQGSYRHLQKTIDKIEMSLRKYPGTTDVDTNLKFDSHVYEARFNRDEAASLGVNLQDVSDTLTTMLSGSHITDIQKGNLTYDVMVQMRLHDLSSFAGLNSIYVRSDPPAGSTQVPTMVPLSNLVNLTSNVRQTNLYRYSLMRSASVVANIAPGYDIGQVVKHINGVLAKDLNSTEQYVYSGRVQAFLQAQGEMLSLFALSIIFIYLVLAAQFESFVDPFIILLTVPLCIVGAIATLRLAGGSLNLFTNIGLITLVGLITKHGILITQFANTRLLEGQSLRGAICDAAVVRLRPILMTTFAMVLGALPLALATGPGSVGHSQIGWIIVGGMLFGTFFSLVVVPVAYYLLAGFDHKKRELLLASE
jgi:hydrophobe/amphiphile efflux-1 (HAE1) family protein